MMHEFLAMHREELVNRCLAERDSPQATAGEIEHGIPLFLDQLIKTLLVGQSEQPMRSRAVSGPAGGGTTASSEVAGGATRHGRELSYRGFPVEQVVHCYGDLCQAARISPSNSMRPSALTSSEL
jgi:hypothetical protein